MLLTLTHAGFESRFGSRSPRSAASGFGDGQLTNPTILAAVAAWVIFLLRYVIFYGFFE